MDAAVSAERGRPRADGEGVLRRPILVTGGAPFNRPCRQGVRRVVGCRPARRSLVRFPFLNPPNDEAACAGFVGQALAGLGFDVRNYEFAPGRPSLVARIGPSAPHKPLAFTGHLDVVPVGEAPWRFPPFDAVVDGGKLYGQEACDMKAGVAAFIAAAARLLERRGTLRRKLVFGVTAGEETGCQGAFDLARRAGQGRAAGRGRADRQPARGRAQGLPARGRERAGDGRRIPPCRARATTRSRRWWPGSPGLRHTGSNGPTPSWAARRR